MSSIEEDIKMLESLDTTGDEEFTQAINNILNDYTRQKQINEEHQKINGELREKVKELEKENELILNSKIGVDLSYDDYVPKQKIKDKFEKIQLLYENNLKEVDLKEEEKIDIKIFECIRLEAQRDLARELLQEEDK